LQFTAASDSIALRFVGTLPAENFEMSTRRAVEGPESVMPELWVVFLTSGTW